jgi:hypothetical protein
LSGEKTTTIRAKSRINCGEIVQLIDTDENHIVNVRVMSFYRGFSIDKDGINVSGFSHEIMQKILKSEGFSWEELVMFIHKQYGLPFFGVVIEWDNHAI